MTLRFGFFPDFKGDNTLLIWGNDGFDKLRDLFKTLADQAVKSIDFKDSGYFLPAGSCSVTVSFTRTDQGRVCIAMTSSETIITCYLTQKDLTSFSAKIDALVENKDAAGHQFLDIENPQPFQMILAKGEYPADFEAER